MACEGTILAPLTKTTKKLGNVSHFNNTQSYDAITQKALSIVHVRDMCLATYSSTIVQIIHIAFELHIMTFKIQCRWQVSHRHLPNIDKFDTNGKTIFSYYIQYFDVALFTLKNDDV